MRSAGALRERASASSKVRSSWARGHKGCLIGRAIGVLLSIDLRKDIEGNTQPETFRHPMAHQIRASTQAAFVGLRDNCPTSGSLVTHMNNLVCVSSILLEGA